jgi:hypothetical protein
MQRGLPWGTEREGCHDGEPGIGNRGWEGRQILLESFAGIQVKGVGEGHLERGRERRDCCCSHGGHHAGPERPPMRHSAQPAAGGRDTGKSDGGGAASKGWRRDCSVGWVEAEAWVKEVPGAALA